MSMSMTAERCAAQSTLLARVVLAFTFFLAGAVHPAHAGGSSATDVVVGAIKGEVHVSMHGTEQAVKEGTVVDLPATVRTASGASIELRQGETTIKVAADSAIEIPATANRGELLDRIVQTGGNAFYSVAKRTAKKLRVETPFLVAVIKGTQFNVAVQNEMATISLYEGKLEIHATDESDVVQLNAGEIAIRHGTDKTIRVIRMDNGQPVKRENPDERAALPTTGSDDSAGTIPSRSPVDSVGGNLPIGVSTPVAVGTGGAVNGGGVLETVDVSVDTPLERVVPGVKADAAVDLEVGTAGGSGLAVSGNVATSAGVGGATVDVGASVDASVAVVPGNVSVDLGTSTSVGVGSTNVGVGTSTSVDLSTGSSGVGASIDTGVGVTAGSTSVDLGASTSINAGSGGANVSAGATVAVGSAPVADANLNVGLGTTTAPSLNVDTSVSTPVADVGATVGAGTGGVSAGVIVGGGLGVDLNLGGSAPVVDISTPTPAPAAGSTTGGSIDTGGLLGKVGKLLGHN